MRFCRQICPLVSESWIRSAIKILDEFILETDHLEEDFRDRRRIEVSRRFVTEQDVLDVEILGLQRIRGSPSDMLVEGGKTQVDQRVAHREIRDALQDTLKPFMKQVCLRVSIDFVQHGLPKKSVAFI